MPDMLEMLTDMWELAHIANIRSYGWDPGAADSARRPLLLHYWTWPQVTSLLVGCIG